MPNLSRRALLSLMCMPGGGQSLPLRPSKAIGASPLSVNFGIGHDRMKSEVVRRALPFAGGLGVKHARLTATWEGVEPRAGEYDFAWLDEIVDGLLAQGVTPWLTLGLGSRVYSPEAPAPVWSPLANERSKQAWLRYVRKTVERYRGKVDEWEIWNEPEFENYWGPNPPAAQEYVDLVRHTVPAIRTANPKATVIGGALTIMPSLLSYLEQCLDLGLASLVDKISFHPYRAVPEANYENEVRAMRSLIGRHRKDIPLWQGEVGCPSGGGGGALSHLEWNESRQAKWLLRRVLTDLWLELERSSYFMLVDSIKPDGSMGNSKGLVDGNTFRPKPAYSAYRNLCSLFDRATSRSGFLVHFARSGRKNQLWNSREEPLEWPSLCTLSFHRAGKPMAAWWNPSVLQTSTPPAQASLLIWVPKELRLERPVLIDLLSGEIRRLTPAMSERGFFRFDPVPVLDYPLLIGDEAILAA